METINLANLWKFKEELALNINLLFVLKTEMCTVRIRHLLTLSEKFDFLWIFHYREGIT